MGAALKRTGRTSEELESDLEADNEKFDGEESNKEDERTEGLPQIFAMQIYV